MSIIEKIEELKNSSVEQTLASQALAQEVAEKMADIDTKVAEASNAFQQFQESSRGELGFVAQNYNHDFLELVTMPNGQKLPVGMGVNAGGNFFDKFEVNMIPAISGADPDSRDPVAQELLTEMGCNTKHFTRSFNILHVKRIPGSPAVSGYTFFIPEQHIKAHQGASFVFWAKGRGTSWGMDTGMVWQQRSHTWRAATHESGNPGAYIHVDVYMNNEDSELYLALPTIVVEHWPENRKLGNLYNQKSQLIRKFGTA